MKFIGAYTIGEKIRRKEEWHKWFAWRPVIVNNHTNDVRKVYIWLETIERRGIYCLSYVTGYYWKYTYRELKNDSENKKSNI